MGTDRFVIFAGMDTEAEDAVRPRYLRRENGDFFACADSGYRICKALGIKPDAVVGDFDSLTEEEVDEIDRLGAARIVYPREKDDTDTMAAVKYGLARGFERFLIAGGIGGDFGHTMANIQALSFLMDLRCEAEIQTGSERILMADGESLPFSTQPAERNNKPAVPVIITGIPGSGFSVLSYAERSAGVCIKNAKYELDDAVLTQSYPIGVSNEFLNNNSVTVSVKYGRLLVVIAM